MARECTFGSVSNTILIAQSNFSEVLFMMSSWAKRRICIRIQILPPYSRQNDKSKTHKHKPAAPSPSTPYKVPDYRSSRQGIQTMVGYRKAIELTEAQEGFVTTYHYQTHNNFLYNYPCPHHPIRFIILSHLTFSVTGWTDFHIYIARPTINGSGNKPQ